VRRHDSIVSSSTTNITRLPKRPDIISESYERRQDDDAQSNDSGRTVGVEKTPFDNYSSPVSSDTQRSKTGSRLYRSTSFPDLKSGGNDMDIRGVRGVDRTATSRSRVDHGVYQSYLAGVLQSSKQSDKFVRLRRMYAIVERITDIENELQYVRATAASDSSFQTRHQHLDVEGSVQDKARRQRWWFLFKELSDLYARLDAAYGEKQFFFNTGNVKLDKLRWKSWNDYGLVMRKTPLVDLRAVYSGTSTRDQHANSRTGLNDSDVRQHPFTRLLALFRKLDDRACSEQARRRWFQKQRQSSLVGDGGSCGSSVTGDSAHKFDGTYIRIMEHAAVRSRERPMYGYHMDEYQHPYDKYVRSRRLCIPRSSTNIFHELTDDDDDDEEEEDNGNVTRKRLDAWSERKLRVGRVSSFDDSVKDTLTSKRTYERSFSGRQVNVDMWDAVGSRPRDVNNNSSDDINKNNDININSLTSQMLGVTERNRNMLSSDNPHMNHAGDVVGQKLSNQADAIGEPGDVTGDCVHSTVSSFSSSLLGNTAISSNKVDSTIEYQAERTLPAVAPSSGKSRTLTDHRTANSGNSGEHGPRINIRALRRQKEKWRRCSRPLPGTVNNVLTYLSSVNFDASCLNSRHNTKNICTVTSSQVIPDLQRSTDVVDIVDSSSTQPMSAGRNDDNTSRDNMRQVASDVTTTRSATQRPADCDGYQCVVTSSAVLLSGQYDHSESSPSVNCGRSTERVECTVSDVVPAALRHSNQNLRLPSGRSTPSDVTQRHCLQAVRPMYVTSPTYVTRPISVVSKKIEPKFIRSRCAAVRKLDRLSTGVTAVEEQDGGGNNSRAREDSGIYSGHSPVGDTVYLSLTTVEPCGNSQSCSTRSSTSTLHTADWPAQSSTSCTTNRNSSTKTMARGRKLPAAEAESSTHINHQNVLPSSQSEVVHDYVINNDCFVTSFSLGDKSVPASTSHAWNTNSTAATPIFNVSVNSELAMPYQFGKKQAFMSSCENSSELVDVSTVRSTSGLSSANCDITPVKHIKSSGTRRKLIVAEAVRSDVQGGTRTRRRSVARDVVKSGIVDRSTTRRQPVLGDNVESDIDGVDRRHGRRRARRQDSVLMSTMMSSLDTISGEWARNGPRRSATSPDPTTISPQQKEFADHVTATSSPLAAAKGSGRSRQNRNDYAAAGCCACLSCCVLARSPQ